MRAKRGLGGAGRTFEHHVVLVGRRRLLALGGQQLVDLNLGAPHRDLLFGPVQPDQLVEPGLRLGQHRVLLGGQRGGVALTAADFGGRIPLVGAGGDGVGVGDDQPQFGLSSASRAAGSIAAPSTAAARNAAARLPRRPAPAGTTPG